MPSPVKRDRPQSLVERLITGTLIDPERQSHLTAMESIADDTSKEPDAPGALEKITKARSWYLANRPKTAATRCGTTGPDVAGIRPDVTDFATLRTAARTVAEGLRQDAATEVCDAITVTCRPCSDDAVPLAVLTVEGCAVTDVCEYVRRPALTGPAIRSWLPVDWLFEQAERLCCGDGKASDVAGLIRRAVPVRDVRDAEPVLSGGERKILTMLNSQVQGLRARLHRLEKVAD